MDEISGAKRLILNKLVRSSMWGGKHTPLDFVLKGLPQQFRTTHAGQKIIEKVLKELQNNQLIMLMQKRTGKDYAIHISLNPRKVAEIQDFLASFEQH